MSTIGEFISAHGITCRVVSTSKVVPTLEKYDARMRKAHKWTVTLICGNESMDVEYTMGLAHVTPVRAGMRMPLFSQEMQERWVVPSPPTVDQVLDSLASDAALDDLSFDEFCGEMGFDTDSRKAFATYEAVRDQTRKLRRLMGRQRFDELLSEVERL